MPLTLPIADHPLLDIGVFATRFSQPLAELPPVEMPPAPVEPLDETGRTLVRNLLRHGGFKPSGRSKPASEYLIAAHSENRFPRINAAVDACNYASLFWGLPISLVDLDKVSGELSVRICPPGTSYVFNPSGQVIDASGLLAIYDSEGPTGTPVKDAQRTKTHDGTMYTLALVWGTNALPGRTEQATRWYRDLVARIAGASNEDVTVRAA